MTFLRQCLEELRARHLVERASEATATSLSAVPMAKDDGSLAPSVCAQATEAASPHGTAANFVGLASRPAQG